MVECAAQLVDVGPLYGPPSGLVGDPVLPLWAGPVEVWPGDELDGGFAVLEPLAPSITLVRLRVRLTDPTAAADVGWVEQDLPPGRWALWPLVMILPFSFANAAVEPRQILSAQITVNAAPPGAPEIAAETLDAPGASEIVASFTVAENEVMPAGVYDLTAELIFDPIGTGRVGLALGSPNNQGEGPGIELVSWEVCAPSVDVDLGEPACIGSGEYEARLIRRSTLLGDGGSFMPVDLAVIGGSWGRKSNATSSAAVTVATGDRAVNAALREVDPSVTELEIWRSGELVWSGPTKDLLDQRDGTALITADDVSMYVLAERIAVPHAWVDVDLATIFAELVAEALAADDPRSFDLTVTPTGIAGTRAIAETDVKLVGNELGELSRTAVDWTVTAARWWVSGREPGAGYVLPVMLTDDAFAEPPKIRVSRSAMATEVVVRGNSVVGRWGGPRADDGVLIQKAVDESSIADEASATAAARTLWDRIREPVVIVEGSNARLDPRAPVAIQTLIPGALVPVNIGDVLRYRGTLRLDAVDVTFGPDGEAVNVTLQPTGTPAEGAT